MLGIAARKEKPPIPVRIEYIAPGAILYCRILETGRSIVVHHTDFTPMPQIPSRYKQAVFDSVAPYWAEALNKYPKAIIITPKDDESIETLARKLRESRVGKLQYGWKHAAVDEKLWERFQASFHVTISPNGTIRLGPSHFTEVCAFEAVLTSQNVILVSAKNTEVIENFCNLVSQRVFDPKPSFVIYGLTPEQAADLQNRYDLILEPRQDGKSFEVVF